MKSFSRILLITALLAPFIPLLIWSISFRWYFPSLLPTELSPRAWLNIIQPQTRVLPATLNSFSIAASTTLLSIVIGIPAGRALALHKFKGKTFVEFLILAPTIIPTLAVAMGIHNQIIRYRLADTLLGVILVHLIPVLPYVVFVLASVFSSYNVDFESQARSLGANRWQTFRHITLPAILPGVIVGGLFAFIISWSQYILTLLIGGGNVLTLPILLFSTASGGDNALTASLSIVFIIPAVLFLIATSRFLTGNNPALGGFGKL